jgi:hypothetical protein
MITLSIVRLLEERLARRREPMAPAPLPVPAK